MANKADNSTACTWARTCNEDVALLDLELGARPEMIGQPLVVLVDELPILYGSRLQDAPFARRCGWPLLTLWAPAVVKKTPTLKRQEEFLEGGESPT
jgi:hypothetical protein